MKYGRFGILALVVLIVAALGLAVLGPRMFQKNSVPQLPIPQHPSRSGVSSKGVVESQREISLSSQIQGLIEEMTVAEGDLVKSGQQLVRLDDKKIKAHLELVEASRLEAEALLQERIAGSRSEDIAGAQSSVQRSRIIYDQKKNEAQRQKRLFEKEATTRYDMEQTEETMQVALAQLNEAQAKLSKLQTGSSKESIEQAKAGVAKVRAEIKYTRVQLSDYTLISPFDGLVIERFMDKGETVDIGTPLLTVIDPENLRIRAEVEETDVGRIRQGQAAEIFVDAFPERVFNGKVYKVFPNVSKKAQKTFDPMASFDINTQKIYLSLDDFSGLLPGMTVTVRFKQ